MLGTLAFIDSGEPGTFLQEALGGRRTEDNGARAFPKAPSGCLEDQARETYLQTQ